MFFDLTTVHDTLLIVDWSPTEARPAISELLLNIRTIQNMVRNCKPLFGAKWQLAPDGGS